MPKILIVKTGTTDEPVVKEHGDYDDWFKKSLAEFEINWSTVSIFNDEILPCPSDFDGILITGSPSSVWEMQPWMTRALPWLHALCSAQTTPVLAVCFGHQLMAQALGVDICPNPRGAEIGTIRVNLTPSGKTDPLFNGLSHTFEIQSIHKDITPNLPQGAGLSLLASTANTEIQAFAVGPNIRAVQFHPELTASALQSLVTVRQIEARVTQTDNGYVILKNWFKAWIAQ